MPNSRTAILVLGMHRSGTSSVTGSLAILGATPPRTLMRPADDNPKGFWESEILSALNDRVLKACNSSWHDWKAFDAALAGPRIEDLKVEAARLIETEFGEADLIALKDPRICRMVSFWREVLETMGYRVVCLSPLRAPAEVAASLMARNDMTRSHALRLWLRHVLDAEHFSRDLPRLILPWTDFLSDWRGQISRILATLELDLKITPQIEAQMDEFLSADLKHQNAAEPVPDWIANTYQHLLALSQDAENPHHRMSLDHLRNGFNAAEPLFLDAPS